MADNTSNSDRFARDTQRRTTAATAIGMIALKPIMHFQVSMLRMWADSIERFAGNYKRGSKKPQPQSRNNQKGTRRVNQRESFLRRNKEFRSNFRPRRTRARSPHRPHLRTSSAWRGTSEMCQNRTSRNPLSPAHGPAQLVAGAGHIGLVAQRCLLPKSARTVVLIMPCAPW